MNVNDSWLKFKNLRDQYNLVKSDFEQINQYLLPGRHLDSTQLMVSSEIQLAKAAADVLNDVGGESLNIFAAMMYGTLTPPTQIWFEAQFDDNGEQEVSQELKAWMYRSTRALHKQLHRSNFYIKMQQFYRELGGYCTAAVKCVNLDSADTAVGFEFLPTGTYLFDKNYEEEVENFFRISWKTPFQIVGKYPDTAPDILKEMVDNESSAAYDDVAIIEHTYRLSEPTEEGYTVKSILFYPVNSDKKDYSMYVLEETYDYEMPFFVIRAEENETTEWGSGPGLHAMADILRLQEVERTEAFGMHKMVDPPLLASSALEGRLKTLPGSYTFTDMNPAIKTYVESMYKVPLDLESPYRKIQRIENQIKRRFFVDVFFSMQRDPNLSPLKAREIDQRDEDKYVRLGPLVTGTYLQVLKPMITRVFNISLRRFMENLPSVLPKPPMEMVAAMQSGQFASSYTIELTSPLAKQQNVAAIGPITTLISLTQSIMAVKPDVIDNLDGDAAFREIASLVGTAPRISRAEAEVSQIRQDRYATQDAQAKQQQQMASMEMEMRMNESRAKVAGDMSKAQSAMAGGGLE